MPTNPSCPVLNWKRKSDGLMGELILYHESGRLVGGIRPVFQIGKRRDRWQWWATWGKESFTTIERDFAYAKAACRGWVESRMHGGH